MILDPGEIAVWLGKGSTLTDAEAALIAMIQPMVERSIKAYCGCNLEPQKTYTHYLPQRRRGNPATSVRSWDVSGDKAVSVSAGRSLESESLWLPERPVRSITSVNVDEGAYGGQGSTDFSGSNLVAGTDYQIDELESGLSISGKLIRRGSFWPSFPRTVKVVYTAGFTQAELTYDSTNREAGIAANVKLATLYAMQAVFAQHGVDAGDIVSEKLGDYSVKYAGGIAQELPKRSKKLLRPFITYARFI